ncbi:MAG: hypothetical protein QY320_12810 [Gammaproteobacteria bacterium]|nr:MAG: hypothetical protein QY320_12810 [Gammaproteobacteria bacterium]
MPDGDSRLRDIMSQLGKPKPLWEPRALTDHPALVPDNAGLYAWYFLNLPGLPNGWGIQKPRVGYVGISPSTAEGKATLRERLRAHLSGNARGSTLRFSLGSLLMDALPLDPQPAGRGITWGSEGLLSGWMAEHARVMWVECEVPSAIEQQIIELFTPPLNLNHNQANPFRPTLRERRREARRRARLRPGV